MRKLILILFCIPLIGFGQENTELIQIQQEINMMKENLNSHHKQNKAGFILSVIGSSSAIVGTTLIISPPLAIGGAAISFIGGIIMFNSHKWFGKKKMRGHFILGKRNKRHSLKKIYHKGNNWKIGEKVDCYVNEKFESGEIKDIILLSNDEVEFEIKLDNGNIITINWIDLMY